jgi:hypothetical protein
MASRHARPRNRLVLLPIADLLPHVAHLVGTTDERGQELGLPRVLAEPSGSAPRSTAKWVAAGALPLPAADRICCRLGLHLALVWPSLYAVAS